jgi:hypothetical protein
LFATSWWYLHEHHSFFFHPTETHQSNTSAFSVSYGSLLC